MGRGLTLAAAATLRGAFSAYLVVSGGPPCALHHLSMPHAATSSPRPALLPAASSRSLLRGSFNVALGRRREEVVGE